MHHTVVRMALERLGVSEQVSVKTALLLCNAMCLGILLSSISEKHAVSFSFFFYLNPGQPRTLLHLKLVGILTINLFLT
jgi:hypothetical protein